MLLKLLLIFVVLQASNACHQLNIKLQPKVTVNMKSKNFPMPYPNDFHSCKYTGVAPPEHRIVLFCPVFDILYSDHCMYTYFEFSPTGDKSFLDADFYCGKKSNLTLETTGNHFAVSFENLGFNKKAQKGYNCYLEAVPVGTQPIQPVPSGPLPPPPPANTLAPPCVTVSPTGAKPEVVPGSKPQVVPPTAKPGTVPVPLPTPPSDSCNCGIKKKIKFATNKIVGGTVSDVNEYPWLVAMKTKKDNNQFCGGSLIDSEWILTASHCTDGLDAKKIEVVVGEHDLTHPSETKSVNHAISKIIMHEHYNKVTTDNDIALLKLEKPVRYSDIVGPVCLPYRFQDNDFHGKKATVAGWGTTSSGGHASQELRHVTLPVLLNSQCKQFSTIAHYMSKNMICSYERGKDSCQGDSGGPLFYENSGRNYQIGIVSWGIGCAEKNSPGVYAKVNNYLSWIQSKIGRSLCNPPPYK